MYSKYSWNLNTMLGLNNIQSPLRYGVRNIKNVIECQFVCDCPYKRHSPSFLMFLRTSHFKYPLKYSTPPKVLILTPILRYVLISFPYRNL
jgi:hypothetical protein